MVIGMNRVFKFGASGIFPEVLFADSDGLCRPVGELPALPASPKPHSGLRRTFDAYVILCVGYCSVLTSQPCTVHALRIGNLKKVFSRRRSLTERVVFNRFKSAIGR